MRLRYDVRKKIRLFAEDGKCLNNFGPDYGFSLASFSRGLFFMAYSMKKYHS